MRKITRPARVVAAILLLTLGALGVSGEPASADHARWPLTANRDEPVEINTGTRTTAPTNPTFCVNDRFAAATAKACWVAAGDIWYVQDLSGDGRSAIAIWEDWVCPGDGPTCTQFWRQGVCRNPHGANTWARCNKDYYETGHVLYMAAGTSEGADVHIMDFGPFAACRPQTNCFLR